MSSDIDPRRDSALLKQIRTTVGMVFQQFNLFPHLTVLQNLCEAPVHVNREPFDKAQGRAVQLLDRVGLTEKKDQYPRNLSGGQMQRVAIARTLMMNPQAILFDEPTSALDPVMASEVLAVIADLAQSGQTMIVVTHSTSFARNVANKVHVFVDGHDVESGPPEAVFENPQHGFTRAFLAGIR
jgi:ABC-type polar amino acid transport system ATPase subunit